MKMFLYCLAGLIGLIFVGLFVFLAPAHIQIRSIDAVLPDLESLRNNPAGHIQLSFINTASQKGPLGEISHASVVLEWQDGKRFLIDSGMDAEAAIAFGKPVEKYLGGEATRTFGAVHEQAPEKMIRLGGIGFTHLHSDHTFGVTGICAMNPDVVIFQTPVQASEHNHLTQGGQDWIDASGCQTTLLGEDLIQTVPGFEGLYVIQAAGHTPGSTVFLVHTGKILYIFAGDLTNSMKDVLEDNPKGFLYSYLLVPENTDLLAKWRDWLLTVHEAPDIRVVVAHDLQSYLAAGIQPAQ